MAAQNRPARDHLTKLRDAAGEADRYGFFALLRAAEARAPDLPRIGLSRLPSQNVVDLAHASEMAFPASTVSGVEFRKSGRATVRGRFLGLTGPMGPLPLHLTEFAYHERRFGRNQPFGRFLDLLNDRMLQLFYRAWADSQPAAQADRPADDRFAAYVAALTGALEGAREGDAFDRGSRLHYAGLFASRRSAAVVQDGVSHMLGSPVRLREFLVRWREIDPADRTRLGPTGGFNQLGRDAVLGGRAPVADDAFQVSLRAEDMVDYDELLPTGRRFAVAREALDALAPPHLEWEIQLEIDERAIRPARLGGLGRLGWSAWTLSRPTERVRTDTRLRRRTISR